MWKYVCTRSFLFGATGSTCSDLRTRFSIGVNSTATRPRVAPERTMPTRPVTSASPQESATFTQMPMGRGFGPSPLFAGSLAVELIVKMGSGLATRESDAQEPERPLIAGNAPESGIGANASTQNINYLRILLIQEIR